MDYSNLLMAKQKIFAYSENPQPSRTVCIPAYNVCQFCPNPIGHVRVFDYDCETKHGYVSCGKKECKEKAEQKIEEYYDMAGWKTVKNIIDKNSFVIIRSNGNIDYDWKFLYRTYTFYGPAVVVSNDEYNKYVPFHIFIDWNLKIEN
ncbi:hypothetical protein Catovirus_1_406 [Catovirus CTV1]|uniref:Uncharacterized protein n=1 Tax=Catovirus CTV1 TaxID=1977631 RepID=A0A1V0S9G3_9VIRU|nr:hypothetical protein Catovirus_1_406 [Catovirus CTV1]